MCQRIDFRARGSPGGHDDLSSHHIEIDKPGEGALADILELAAQDMVGLHGQVGMFALQGLHAGEFI
jgi:hypothetical protein